MSSALLEIIKHNITAALSVASQLRIDETLLTTAGVGGVFEGAFGDSALLLSGVEFIQAQDMLTVRGTCAILDASPIPVDVFIRDSNGLNISLEARVPANTPLMGSVLGKFVRGKYSLPTGMSLLRVKTLVLVLDVSKNAATLSFADTGDTRIADLLTLRQPKVSITAIGLNQPTPALTVSLEGSLVFDSVPYQLSGQLLPTPSLDVWPLASGLKATAEQFLKDLMQFTASQLSVLFIDGVKIQADSSFTNVNVSAALGGEWDISFGSSSLKIKEAQVTVEQSTSGMSGRVFGKMPFRGQEIAVQCMVPGDLEVAGDLPAVDLLELVQDLVGPVLTIPAGVPSFKLNASHFKVRFESHHPSLILTTNVDHLGSLVLLVMSVSGKWECVAAVVPPGNWSLKDLSPALAPLNVLVIRQPKIILSSFVADKFELPQVAGQELPLHLEKGFQFLGSLALQGAGLEFVAKLVGISELPLQLAASTDISKSQIVARLGGERVVVPGVLTLSNVGLQLQSSPFSITLQSGAIVTIGGTELPTFQGDVAVGPGMQKLTLATSEPWANPLGISGLTITNLILDLQTLPTPAYGVLGEVAISGRKILVACQFVSGSPSAMIGELQDRLALSEVTKELVGLPLPAIFDIAIENFQIHIVSNPLGVDIGPVHFEPGLTVRGTLEFLKIRLLVNVLIRPESGIFASGSLSAPLKIGKTLILSSINGSEGPSVLLDTTVAPVFRMDCKLALLGLTETIQVSLEKSGFSLHLAKELAIAHYDIDVLFESAERLRCTGSWSFGLKAELDTDLGTLVLDSGFDGHLKIWLLDGAFELTAGGTFVFAGNTIVAGNLHYNTEIESLEDLPARVRDDIVDHLKDLVKDVLQDPSKWVRAIAVNAIQGVENVAEVLKTRFGQDADFIGEQLKKVLGLSSLDVAQRLAAIGEAPEKIAAVLKKLGDDAVNVRNALDRLGIAADKVHEIMGHIFSEIPHIDGPAVQHVDFYTVPAVNTPAGPHADAYAIPHADIGPGPHSDFYAIPHVDHEGPHADTPHNDGHPFHTDTHIDHGSGHFHVDSHTDAAGPHVDIPGVDTHEPAHIDTPAQSHSDGPVPPHTDTPPQNHTDGPVPKHVDTPPQGHVDTPEQGHVDVP